ncbi:ATP-binding protein [Spongiactinospora sp. TRM90649]|uniref:ATP-binding protein n=1 Tax=Spongiactinospora sp. TRM90649 TaxID=3031114 RepID=UPI0023F6C8C2|nr:ATP-binding protein [Spongiactinospora sp. TRM90649]MDF5751898.1 ATP-binding protein [Spongiactinospora sp. TRM90649]
MPNPSPPIASGDTRSRQACFDVPDRLEAIGEARRFVRQALARWRLADITDDVALIVTELITNSLAYGKEPIRLTLRADGRAVRGEVSDHGSALPTLMPADLYNEHGRGLILVNAYADRWGIDPAASGKTVWFVRRAAAATEELHPAPDRTFAW